MGGQFIVGMPLLVVTLSSRRKQAEQAIGRELVGSILPRLCISFSLQVLDSTEVAERVAGRKAEIGFTGTVINLPKCVYQPLTEDRLVIITPNTSKYQAFQATGFPVRQLTREAFISREPGSGTRLETESFLKEMGVDMRDIRIAVEVRSTESIKQMVSEGLGIAVISKSACEDYCQFKKLLSFNFDSVNLRQIGRASCRERVLCSV